MAGGRKAESVWIRGASPDPGCGMGSHSIGKMRANSSPVLFLFHVPPPCHPNSLVSSGLTACGSPVPGWKEGAEVGPCVPSLFLPAMAKGTV